MAKKADAWKEYREAAVVDMVLATMPKVTSTTLFYEVQLGCYLQIISGKLVLNPEDCTSAETYMGYFIYHFGTQRKPYGIHYQFQKLPKIQQVVQKCMEVNWGLK